jgi:hypothetical protein
VLAYALPQPLVALLDAWWPKLVRVVTVKIAVMSTSADACIKCVLACCQDAKLLAWVLEMCTAKNAILRVYGMQYLILAHTLWRLELLEKHLATVKSVLKAGLTDADSEMRRQTRLLYALLTTYPYATRSMSLLYEEADSSTQKHLLSEGKGQEVAALVALPRVMLQYYDAREEAHSGAFGQSDRVPPELAGDVSVGVVEALEETVLPSVRTRGAASRRLSLSGPVRLAHAGTGAAAAAAGGADADWAGGAAMSSVLSKPAGRRLSAAANPGEVMPPCAPATTAPLSVGVALPAATSRGEDDLLDMMQAAAAAATPSSRALLGKENRRASLSSNLAATAASAGSATAASASATAGAMSALLAQGAKRILAPSGTAGSTAPEAAETAQTRSDPAATAPTGPAVVPTPPQQPAAAAVPIFCALSSLKLAHDDNPSIRYKACEDINKRVYRAFTTLEPLEISQVEVFLVVGCQCSHDQHLKVAAEGVKIMQCLLEMASESCSSKLPTLLAHIFQVLDDRRASLREAATTLLTLCRRQYPAPTLINALILIVLDLPERTKTALMQFLGVLLSRQGQLLPAELAMDLAGKLGDMVTVSQPKPTITFVAASKRVVVMIYKMYPEVRSCTVYGSVQRMRNRLLSLP